MVIGLKLLIFLVIGIYTYKAIKMFFSLKAKELANWLFLLLHLISFFGIIFLFKN